MCTVSFVYLSVVLSLAMIRDATHDIDDERIISNSRRTTSISNYVAGNIYL